MGELRKTTDLVYDILKQDEAARDSDNVLYCKVLEYYGKRLNVDFNRVSVMRKLQEEYYELRGSENVERERRAREKDFRSYARY